MAQYLSFTVNDKLYLFSIEQVHSIIKKPVREISNLPEAPIYFLGLTQLREKTIGVLSASILFESKRSEETNEYNIVIIKSGDELYGIVVDIVNGVKNIDLEKISTTAMMIELNKYVVGVYNDHDDLHLVIDVKKLVEMKNVNNIK